MKYLRLLFLIVCLAVYVQPADAQRFPRSIAISERVGDTIEKHEQAYFGLFPGNTAFSVARVLQTSNSSYQIVISRTGAQQEVLELNIPQFEALQNYINTFEERYTGARATNWDYITAFTAPLHQPFGPADTYEFTLITGRKQYGKIVWADEQGVYISQRVSAKYPSETGSRMTYIPRSHLFRLNMQKSLLRSFQDKLDILYAGEPSTYTSLTLPQLKAAALHPRSMPPELYALSARNNMVPAEPPADPDWRIFRTPPQSSMAHVLFYFAPLNYINPGFFNVSETAVSELGGPYPVPSETVSANLETQRPLFFGALRFTVHSRLRLGVSVSQTAVSSLEEIANDAITGNLIVSRTQLVRSEPGLLKVGGTFANFDITYLLKAAKDYVQIYQRSNRGLGNLDIKLTVGPSVAFARTEAQVRSVGRVLTEEISLINAIYGTTTSERGIFPGAHAALEIGAFLNGSWSVGILMDASAYFNYKVPTQVLNDNDGTTVKVLRSPSDNILWLSAFYFGIAHHF